jgi:hypothetical protein
VHAGWLVAVPEFTTSTSSISRGKVSSLLPLLFLPHLLRTAKDVPYFLCVQITATKHGKEYRSPAPTRCSARAAIWSYFIAFHCIFVSFPEHEIIEYHYSGTPSQESACSEFDIPKLRDLRRIPPQKGFDREALTRNEGVNSISNNSPFHIYHIQPSTSRREHEGAAHTVGRITGR